jgi:light-regulated signal transduction histidine kinase (bacteriophytochrome)
MRSAAKHLHLPDCRGRRDIDDDRVLMPPRKERFDLNATISEVVVLAQSAIIRNGVSVQTRLAEGLRPVQGDRAQLQQVFLNLILNAVEAMGSVDARARELSISTEQDRTGVVVAMRDSGPGIGPHLLEVLAFSSAFSRPSTPQSPMERGWDCRQMTIFARRSRNWASRHAIALQLGEFNKVNMHLPRTMGLARRQGRAAQVCSVQSQLGML